MIVKDNLRNALHIEPGLRPPLLLESATERFTPQSGSYSAWWWERTSWQYTGQDRKHFLSSGHWSRPESGLILDFFFKYEQHGGFYLKNGATRMPYVVCLETT